MLGHHSSAAISPGLVASAAASSNVNLALSNISHRLTQAATGPIAPTATTTDTDDTEDDASASKQASTSDGESSGGREVKTIIKNSAVARRKKFNEG